MFDLRQSFMFYTGVPSTLLITPKHGFASARFGRRTLSLGRGGSWVVVATRAKVWGLFLPATILTVDPPGVDEWTKGNSRRT
jgi:hypothetical protein